SASSSARARRWRRSARAGPASKRRFSIWWWRRKNDGGHLDGDVEGVEGTLAGARQPAEQPVDGPDERRDLRRVHAVAIWPPVAQLAVDGVLDAVRRVVLDEQPHRRIVCRGARAAHARDAARPPPLQPRDPAREIRRRAGLRGGANPRQSSAGRGGGESLPPAP